MKKSGVRRTQVPQKGSKPATKAAAVLPTALHGSKGTTSSKLFDRMYADAQVLDDMERDFEKVLRPSSPSISWDEFCNLK